MLWAEIESLIESITVQEIEELGRGLNKADNNFEIKRKFINILAIIAKISIIDDEKKVPAICELRGILWATKPSSAKSCHSL